MPAPAPGLAGPWRPLPLRGPYKPLDCGNGLVAASVDPAGLLHAIVAPDPELGVLTLAAQPRFPDALRHDPQAVRRYRAGLAAPDAPGFGLRPMGGWERVEPGLLGSRVPASRLRAGPVSAWVVTFAPSGLRAVVQWWHLAHDRADSLPWTHRWAGALSLTRAALTQLTEGGVLPLGVPLVELRHEGALLTLTSSASPRAVALAGLSEGRFPVQRGEGMVEVDVTGSIDIPPGGWTWRAAWAFGDTPHEARAAATAAASLSPVVPAGRGVGADPLQAVLRRARSYVEDCCGLAVDGTLCLLTDHRILPLSWTRDAYWMARMLLDDGDPPARDMVRRHLRWLFEVADRPAVAWGRSHLPNGAVKDPAFQLDQQCYPLLELAEYVIEYVMETGDDATVARLAGRVAPVLALLDERRDRATGLYPTEETPADDPLPLPFHCSSHVLLWRTLGQLAAAAVPLGLDPAALGARAESLRQRTLEHFAVGDRLAYATDGRGRHLEYHDANDLPTAFAAIWGWCAADDPRWRATTRFAFSSANPAFASGPFGGLGSVHTPGAWPLGDVQEYIVARVTGDRPRAQRVLDRLLATACADGALPEARDPDTGEVRSRHWFAWPGAALAVALRRCENLR